MNTNRKTRIGYFFLFLFVAFKANAQKADVVLFNGKIFTGDEMRPFVSAIAVKSNRIVAIGTDAAIRRLATSKTKQIDLKGKTTVPGFNDQHEHAAFEHSPAPLSYDYHELKWQGPTKSAVLDSLALLLRRARPGQWLAGMIGTTVFHDASMRRALDSIAPNNPVCLQIWWGHGIVANKMGLEAAGLDDGLQDPVGGWYERNTEGKISAVQQNAQVPFWIAVNRSNPGAVVRLMKTFGQDQLRGGITSVLFMGTGFTHTFATQVLRQARIPQRVRLVAFPRSTPEGRRTAEWPVNESYPTATSSISGIKYMIDGTPGEGNSLRSKPYHNRGNGNGRLNYPLDTLRRIFREALATRRQLLMHVTADSSFGIVLKLMAETGTAAQWRPLRPRVEHNTVGPISKNQMKQLKDFGVLMMHTPKYGQESPLRSLVDDGVLVGVSPDGTVNPFFEIFTMTSQQSNPKENMTVQQAVTAFTKTNALAEFSEKEKGTLSEGKLADLAVLSRDIFTVPVQQLMATHSVLTMIDGKVVYEKK